MSSQDRTLFVGVGNPLRKDDGVGVFVVNALQRQYEQAAINQYCDFIESSGEGARLMDAWRGYNRVIVIDALMAQGHPGRLVKLDVNDQNLPSDFFKYSSHAFSLAEAAEMARVLGCLPSSLIVYGIEGVEFGFGEMLSAAVSCTANQLGSRPIETFL